MFQAEPETRLIRCYHCQAELSVAPTARSASCPVCHRGLTLEDLRIKDAASTGRLMTCGRVYIERRARAIVKQVEAGEGVDLHGLLDAKVCSGGPVVVNSGAKLRGECHATSMWVDRGGVIENAFIRIGPQAEGAADPSAA